MSYALATIIGTNHELLTTLQIENVKNGETEFPTWLEVHVPTG